MRNNHNFYWISYYNAYRDDGMGYNLSRGGRGTPHYKFSLEYLESVSGKNNPHYGKKRSKESIERTLLTKSIMFSK
jgi:hypothetical protein